MQSKKYMLYRWSTLLGLLVGAAGCYNNEEVQRIDPIFSGTADFTRYIAVGNSLTAGFIDNGLYRDGPVEFVPVPALAAVLAGRRARFHPAALAPISPTERAT